MPFTTPIECYYGFPVLVQLIQLHCFGAFLFLLGCSPPPPTFKLLYFCVIKDIGYEDSFHPPNPLKVTHPRILTPNVIE